MDLPETLAPLAWLVGTWHGEGHGEYPTIDAFDYREEASYTFTGKPYLAYGSRTWLLPANEPSHAEAGFLRPTSDGAVELVVAQQAGAEVHSGTVDADGRLELASVVVARAPTAKAVTDVTRVIEHRDADVLWYRLDMAAVGQPLGSHCEATLHRG